MPRILRSRPVPDIIAWNKHEQKQAIARHTIPDDRAHIAFRHIVATVKSGIVPTHLVVGLFARTLQNLRDARYPFALISADCANSLKHTLDLANVGEWRHRLEAGLIAATYDTWNLPKFFGNRAMLCYYGNRGDKCIIRDSRNMVTVRADAAKYAERRQHCLDRDDGAIMRF